MIIMKYMKVPVQWHWASGQIKVQSPFNIASSLLLSIVRVHRPIIQLACFPVEQQAAR